MQLFDIVEPADLIGYIRGLTFEQQRWQFGLSQFLPLKLVNDTEFRFTRGNLIDVDAASYRAFDTPAPIAGRKPAVRITGSIPPISRKIPLGEEEGLRLALSRTGDAAPLVAQIYADAANMARSIEVRLELARGEMLETGQVAINENGVLGTITSGRSGSMSVTASPLWSSLSTADPVLDLVTWQQAYIDLNGVAPRAAIVSTEIVNYLLRNEKIRTQAGSLVGTPSIVDQSRLNSVLGSFGIPPLITYIGRARVAGSQVRVLSANKLIFVPPADEPLGNTFYAITSEALRLAGQGYLVNEQLPGIVTVPWEDEDPVQTWVKASAIAAPFMANPDLTMAATVF